MKSESKMVKGKKDKKKKLKQKQKQKQVVKQNVKVNVQSSGGSGSGGSGSPFPQSVPQPFTDRNGENVKLQSLVEQIARNVSVPVMESNQMPIRQDYRAPRYNPANDAATLNDVYNDPINNTSGFASVTGERIEIIPKARKVYTRKPKISIASESESDVPMYSSSSASVFQEPTMIPSISRFNKQMAAQQALFGDN